jgi:hypothetical protein
MATKMPLEIGVANHNQQYLRRLPIHMMIFVIAPS